MTAPTGFIFEETAHASPSFFSCADGSFACAVSAPVHAPSVASSFTVAFFEPTTPGGGIFAISGRPLGGGRTTTFGGAASAMPASEDPFVGVPAPLPLHALPAKCAM